MVVVRWHVALHPHRQRQRGQPVITALAVAFVIGCLVLGAYMIRLDRRERAERASKEES